MAKFWSRLTTLGHTEGGWSELVGAGPSPLQRQLLFLSTFMMASFAALWGGIYYIFGEPEAALIPWAYMAISYTNLALLKKPAHYRLLRSSQLLFSLLLPFFLMWTLGGLVNSSAVVLWSFSCPMGALVFAGRQQALYWFLAFVLLVIVGALIDYPAIALTNNLPVPVIVAFFVLNLTAVSFVAFFLIRYFVVQSGHAYDLLKLEREKTETLVRNMLPAPIAARLKESARPIADRIEGVTIVFVDIVGFTPFSMDRPPEEVVTLLDAVFSNFDQMAGDLDLEKIKTIGDAYMVCGGLSGKGYGTRRAVKFALGALASLAAVRAKHHEGLQVRIGIHRGTVVAGVIGTARYSYDVWGDAVNVAARLQQNSEPGKIMISGEVKEMLGNAYSYEPLGPTELKGHAPAQTFFLGPASSPVQ
jgi:adenylate cyclase